MLAGPEAGQQRRVTSLSYSGLWRRKPYVEP